jgi:non-ribosomal peptide synthetase component E (peptide arylation enzyme)
MEESNSLGMVDEDPDSVPPAQFGRMLKRGDYSLLGIVLYINSSRNNQAIVLQPNLEGWDNPNRFGEWNPT